MRNEFVTIPIPCYKAKQKICLFYPFFKPFVILLFHWYKIVYCFDSNLNVVSCLSVFMYEIKMNVS